MIRDVRLYSLKGKGEETWPGCPEGIVEHGEPISEVNLSRVSINKDKEYLSKDKNDVLVEVIANEPTYRKNE
jgi:hypothetical protein